MKKKRLLKTLFATVLMWMFCATGTWAQMTFTLNGVTYDDVAERDAKGFTTVTLPAGTDLSGLITEVQVDGLTVSASQVTPNPTTTTLNYDLCGRRVVLRCILLRLSHQSRQWT